MDHLQNYYKFSDLVRASSSTLMSVKSQPSQDQSHQENYVGGKNIDISKSQPTLENSES